MRKDGADPWGLHRRSLLWGMELSIFVIKNRHNVFFLVGGQCLRNLPGSLLQSWGLVRLIFELCTEFGEQGTGESNTPRFLFRFIEMEGLE